MRITIKDIARLAGVSTATASLALNQRPGVNAETRKKVLRIAESMDYIPNHAAQSLITRKSKLLGLIVTDIRNPFFSMLVDEFNKESEKLGYNLLLGISSDKISNEKKYIEMFINKSVEGVIVVPSVESNPNLSHLSALNQLSIPFVFCTTAYKEIAAPCIMTDLKTGEYKIVKHLLDKGLRKIYLITGYQDLLLSRLRVDGYTQAFHDSGLSYEKDWIVETFPDFDNGYEATIKIIKENPDAIVTINDFLAMGVIKALKDKNIAVPEKVSVAGYDDLFFVSLIETPLTTVRQPVKDICRKTLEILVGMIEGATYSNETSYLDPLIKIRDSTV